MGRTTQDIGAAAAWSVSGRVARFALGLASSVVVVRALGRDDYGVLSLIRTILLVATILMEMGLGSGLLRFLPALRVKGRQRAARRLAAFVFFAGVVGWAVVTALVWLGRDRIEAIFNFDGLGDLLALAVALHLFETMFARLAQTLFSQYQARAQSVATVTSHVVYLGMLGILLPRGYGIPGVLIAGAAGSLCSILIVLPHLKRSLTFREVTQTDEAHGIDAARLLRFSLPMAAIALLNLIVWKQSETVLLARFWTEAEVAYFDLAYRLPQMILEFVPLAIWPLVMAGMSETYSRNAASLAVAIDRYYRVLFVLCAPLCVGGMVIGGKMITVIYGTEMSPAALPAQLFFGIFTLSFFSTPLSMALMVMEKTHFNLVVYAILAVVNVGLDLLLIPRYGISGAIIPVALVIAMQTPLYRHFLFRQVRGLSIPVGFIARCFAGSVGLVLLFPMLRWVDGPVALGLIAVAGVVLVVLGYRLARVVGPAESSILRTLPIPFVNRLIRLMRP